MGGGTARLYKPADPQRDARHRLLAALSIVFQNVV
jgi:hypothetical protein